MIWTLYGHWLPNDLRGSGAVELRDEKFEPLGPIHHGRKPKQLQPSRKELRKFHKQAEPLLDYSRFWIDDAKRQALRGAFAQVIATRKYAVWACAILSNHAHLVIRRHRDDALTMWEVFADEARTRLSLFAEIDADHPIWSSRPYKVFLRTPDEVRGRIQYVEHNPAKEGFERQHYDFVQPYNNWPFHKMQAARHS
jgi:REP element-mobilizing transposase RayT